MSHDNLGPDVSYVYEDQGYNYDTVVFQKGKPPLDSELNLVQQIQGIINKRQASFLPSGWISMYPIHTDRALANKFYTQNTTNPKPEIANVNGMVLHVTNTGTTATNLNLIDLGTPPTSGNILNGVFLEAWRALLDPDTSTNKPDPSTVIDSLYDIYMHSDSIGWVCGQNGLVLKTENAGQVWSTQLVDTTKTLKGIYFITASIGWVVGEDGFIARSSSGGQKWTTLTSVVSETLNSVYAYSQLIAWAVGNAGTIVKTINGVSWVEKTSGVTANLNKVFFYDNQVGWAVGNSGTIIRTTDGGDHWVAQVSNTTQNLNGIHMYDLNYGFAVGDNGTILRTSDGGASWVSQSGNVYIGSSYTSITENLRAVSMAPTLDAQVLNEEVSSQLDGTNKNFTVANTPITIGDGRGVITNNPSMVTVTVNNVQVNVDSINGTTGAVVLALAPKVNDTVKISYWYKRDCAVFNGKAWAVGDSGRILYTDDIGAKWVPQDPQTSHNIYGIAFYDQYKGWLVGANSVIRNTEDGGTTWEEQQTETFVRQVQRVYYEGNVDSDVFLEDNSIHPDARIETTKRVQIQYRIRVISGADPSSNPEAGLSSTVYGLGPNTTAKFSYENMGPINGDYGLWRAKCENTVDGYCYAIPMFFVARRNSGTYNAATNPNGSNQRNTAFIRPDLLTATEVVDSDVLDVRRRITIPSTGELLSSTFDSLSKNDLKTVMGRLSDGGDRYGTELLHIDRVSGSGSEGGTEIDTDLTGAVEGLITSEASFSTSSVSVATSPTPTQQTLGPVTGIFSTNPVHYSATYVSGDASYSGKPVPGYWDGLGTNTVTFVFDSDVKTDSPVSGYLLAGKYIAESSVSLSYIPSSPKLVKNVSGSGNAPFYYQGVLSTETSRVIESWASEVSGYNNYAVVYPGKDYTDTVQQTRASNVELHYFMKITSSDLDGTVLVLSSEIGPYTDDTKYNIITVSKINNVVSSFSYKISSISFTSGVSSIRITPATGFSFIEGQSIEIVASVVAEDNVINVRNGASVNFDSATKGINTFCSSVWVDNGVGSSTSVTILANNKTILGLSSVETTQSLNSPVCWIGSDLSSAVMTVCTVTGIGTDTVTLTYPSTSAGTVWVQLLVQDLVLPYSNDSNNDALLIAYNFLPYQTVPSLPSSVTLTAVEGGDRIYISNNGATGGVSGQPYTTPIEQIPINDVTLSENLLYNNEALRFNNFSVDTGMAAFPVYVPGSFGESFTLSVPSVDSLGRTFYSICSKELEFSTEGMGLAIPRKVYMPVLARVCDEDNDIFKNGEYLMVIFSRTYITEKANSVGYQAGSTDAIAVYRIQNKPLSRITLC